MQDTVRTSAYQSAILANASTDFEGKIVVDVGTGSGILAWFALQAGAKHVYAIEASGAVNYASRLFAANGVADRVTIIKGKVEEVELPEGVKVCACAKGVLSVLFCHFLFDISELFIHFLCYHPTLRNPTVPTIFQFFVGGCNHLRTDGIYVAS